MVQLRRQINGIERWVTELIPAELRESVEGRENTAFRMSQEALVLEGRAQAEETQNLQN